VFELADPAFGAIGYEGPRESRQGLRDQPDFSKLTASLHRTSRQWMSLGASLEAAGTVGPNTNIRNIHPLAVPQFSLLSKLVQHADRNYQLPWSAVGAVMAEDWGQRPGKWWTSDLAWFTRCDQRVMLNAR
jgi:hypothetical protein